GWARPLGRGADRTAEVAAPAKLPLTLGLLMVHGCLSAARRAASAAAGEGLAFLAPHLFVLVADALALVRLRRPDVPDLGRELPHLLLVRALDDDRRRVAQLDRDAVRRLQRDGVGEADRQDDGLLVHAGL